MTNCVYYWRLITRVYAQASFNTTKTLHWYYQKKKTNEQNCTLLRSQRHHLKSFLEVLLEKLRKITKPTLNKSWLVAYSLLIPQTSHRSGMLFPSTTSLPPLTSPRWKRKGELQLHCVFTTVILSLQSWISQGVWQARRQISRFKEF